MIDDNNEGLIPFRDGLANSMYGDHDWWRGHGFNSHNYEHVFHKIADGIRVPAFALALSSLEDCWNVYRRCAPLQGIINKKAEALTTGSWRIINRDKDDVSDASRLNRKIVDLLRHPNPLQTYADLFKQVSIYRDVFGGAFVYASVPYGFTSISDAVSIWVFSPQEVRPKYKKSIFSAITINDVVDQYTVEPIFYDIKPFKVNPEHMLFIYDTTESANFMRNSNDDIPTKGMRIKSLYYEIRNVMQAQEAIYSLNSDRGAQGIISNTAKDGLGYVPMSSEEKQSIQARFRSRYGMMREQDKVLITNASVSYTPIGFNVKDLMLFEGVRENIMHMSDTYNFPFDLIASEKGKTAADKRIAVETLYEDNIIPFSAEISEKLSPWLGLNQREANLEIDYSNLNIFQKGQVERNNSKRQLAQTYHIMYNGQVVTREEFRRSQGLSPDIDPNGTLKENTDAPYERDDIRITDE